MESLMPLGTVLALAFLCESITEYFFRNILTAFRIDTSHLRYISALVGVGLCLAYSLDLFQDFMGISSRLDYVGEVITGLVLGRGASFVHDFYSSYIRKER